MYRPAGGELVEVTLAVCYSQIKRDRERTGANKLETTPGNGLVVIAPPLSQHKFNLPQAIHDTMTGVLNQDASRESCECQVRSQGSRVRHTRPRLAMMDRGGLQEMSEAVHVSDTRITTLTTSRC